MDKLKKNSEISYYGYFKYVKGFIGNRFYVYVFLNFLIGLFDSLGLAMFIPLLAIATNSDSSGNESLGNLQPLLDFLQEKNIEVNLSNILLIMIILFILKGVFYYLKGNYLNKTLLIALRKIRLKLLAGLNGLSYEGFTHLDAGKVQNIMVAQTGQVMTSMNAYFMSIQHVVMLITYVLMAFLANWKFAIMIAFGAGLTNFLYKYINKVTKKHAGELLSIGNSFSGKLIQVSNNFKYLKATNKFTIFKSRLENDIKNSENISYKIGLIGTIAESLREPMIIIIIAVVLYLQVEVLQNDFSSIMVSLLLFYRSLNYLVSLQSTINSFIKTSVGVNAVENLIVEMDDFKENISEEKIDHINNIELQNVHVTFGETRVLKNINLQIRKNTSIALVGESGAGKTTLANIICGLIIPHEGQMYSDEESIDKFDIRSYREKVGYITQEAVIFDDTLFNNITMWDEKNEENLEKFHQTLKMVALDSFYAGLKDKENTALGNNGILVSGGQKQRISIARELYREVDLLILDEATSALDSETERYIKDSIDLLQGKTTIVIIAHRLSTIKDVDCIYLMHDGEIVESGEYQNLLAKSEKFRKMVQLQEL